MAVAKAIAIADVIAADVIHVVLPPFTHTNGRRRGGGGWRGAGRGAAISRIGFTLDGCGGRESGRRFGTVSLGKAAGP